MFDLEGSYVFLVKLSNIILDNEIRPSKAMAIILYSDGY